MILPILTNTLLPWSYQLGVALPADGLAWQAFLFSAAAIMIYAAAVWFIVVFGLKGWGLKETS